MSPNSFATCSLNGFMVGRRRAKRGLFPSHSNCRPKLSSISDEKKRVKAAELKETIHLRIRLDEIHVNYNDE